MSKKGIVSITTEFGEKIANDFGYDLVDVEFVKDHGNYFLRVYIDKNDGVNINDCQIFSHELSILLDNLEDDHPLKDPYYLEVSSPGLDRPLKTDKDYNRNLGKEVEISLYKPIDNRRKLEGILKDYNKNEIIIDMESEGDVKIPRESVSVMRLVIKF